MAPGHQVRLVPPSYVKAYLKRGKNDDADCEAVTRPNMRFVPVKREEQQGVLSVPENDGPDDALPRSSLGILCIRRRAPLAVICYPQSPCLDFFSESR